MIFLRTATGSQKVEHWEEITTRPNFAPQIVKGDHKFQEIIGHYKFKEEINCGLKGCNQPHGMGYIVKTTTNIEINIGNICGKNEFGVDFDVHVKSFGDFMDLENSREIISSAKNKCTEWLATLENTRKAKPSIDSCCRLIEHIQNANYAGRLAATEIRLLAKSQSGLVTLSEIETDKTIKSVLFSTNKHMRDSGEATSEYEIGKVSFTHVLLPENNLKNLYLSLFENIKLIREIDLINSPSPIVIEVSKIANSIGENLKKLRILLNDATRFLNKKNLSPIVNKLKYSSTAPDSERIKFESFIQNLRK